MAFVQKFTYDVFISYRQVDNQQGWVDRLNEVLHGMLRERAKPKAGEDRPSFSIFQDSQEIAGNKSLSETIRQSVRSSAVLLIVMSDNYLAEDSSWVHHERTEFLDACKPEVGDRLVVVRRSDVDFKAKSYPLELKDLIGYPFFETDRKSGQMVPLSFDFKESGRAPPICDTLGAQVFASLRRQRELSVPATPLTPTVEAKKPVATVFLAEVTDELFRDRGEFYSAFEQEGIAVIPAREKQYRFNHEAAEEELPKLLQSSTLVVQLHGRTPIPSAEKFGPGIESWIFEQAKKAGKVPERSILRWRRRGLKKDELMDDAQCALVFATDVVVEELEDFKQMVIKQARELAQRSQLDLGDGKAKVLLATKQDDVHGTVTRQLANLIDTDGEQLTRFPIESAIVLADVPVAVRECEEQSLPPKALMVVHADSDNQWAKKRMSECRQYQMNQMKKNSYCPPCGLVVNVAENIPAMVPGGFDVILSSDDKKLRAFLATIR